MNSFSISPITSDNIYDFFNNKPDNREYRLTKDQERKIKQRIKKSKELIKHNRQNRIEAYCIDENELYTQAYNRMITEIKQKVKTLEPYYYTLLDNTRNNLKTLQKKIEKENKAYNIEDTIRTLKKQGKAIGREGRIADYLTKKKEATNIKNNIEYAKSYYQFFCEIPKTNYLNSAINLLQSALGYYIRLGCGSCGYETTYKKEQTKPINYYSRNRFDSWSQEKKAYFREKQLIGSLSYLDDQKDLTFSFLTLTFRNVEHLTKEKLKNMSECITKFFNDSQIKKVFKGYYGVLEITHSKNGYHPHYHFMVVRDKSKKTGYMSQPKISEKWEHITTKYGIEEIKGSYIVDIGAKHLKGGRTIDAIRYINKYITKGIKLNTISQRIEIIKATEGIRTIRAGGYLAINKQKNMTTAYETKKQCIESPEIKQKELTSIEKTATFNDIKNSLFKKSNLDKCPFCHKKLVFLSVSVFEYSSRLSDPYILNKLLTNIGLTEQAKRIKVPVTDIN